MPDLESESGRVCTVCELPILWKDLATCADAKDRHLLCMPGARSPGQARGPFAAPPEPARPRTPQAWEYRQGRLL